MRSAKITRSHDDAYRMYVYSSLLEQLGSGSMDIAVPDDEDDDDLKYDLYGAQVAFDNNGNFYEFSAFPKNRNLGKTLRSFYPHNGNIGYYL